MPKLTSLQELTQVREQAKTAIKLRAQTGVVINIGMGTCGIAAGARDIMQALENELAKRQIDAHMAPVGCIGMCAREPLLDIQVAGGSRVLYANVMPEMVPRLIEQHIVKGQPVTEWAVCRMPSE